MADDHPMFTEQGDRVQAALEERLEATRALNRDELDSVCEIVAVSYQQALQLRYAIEQLVATPPEERARLADELERIDQLLDQVSNLHATTRDKLFYGAQRIRSAD